MCSNLCGGFFLGNRLGTVFLDFGFGSQTSFFRRFRVGSELVGLSLDFAVLSLYPFIETSLGLGLRESTFGDAAEQVFLVENALVGKNRPSSVSRLCAFE